MSVLSMPDRAKETSAIHYRPEIDGLRAVAITAVILFHTFGERFPGGYIGVDIFFVISGYLITGIILKEIEDGHFSFARFYERRARRILPALFAMMLFTTAAAFALFLPPDLTNYGKFLIYTTLFGANFKLAGTPGYFAPSEQENPLLHMWSLSVEEQFYLVWPVLLVAMISLLPIRRVRQIAGALFACSLLAAVILVNIWPRSAFFHLPTRGWELLAGALLALRMIPTITYSRPAEGLSWLGLALIIGPVFLYGSDTLVPGFATLVPVLGCAAVIYANTSVTTKAAGLLTLKPMIWIGLASYSLYLWHWPLSALATYALARPLSITEAAVCALLSIPIAALSYRFIEQPFRKRPPAQITSSGQRSLKRLRPAYFAAGVAAALSASGSLFQESKGAPWRYSPETRTMLAQVRRERFESCSAKNRHLDVLLECQFGGGSPDTVLWGDSHAEVLLPMIAKVYGRGIGYFKSGCVPLLDAQLISAQGKPNNPTCQQATQFVINEISRLHPKVIIMASRWSSIEMAGTFFGDASTVLTRENSRQIFDSALKATVARLSAGGSKIVLVGQAPQLNYGVNSCLMREKTTGFAVCDDFVPRKDAEQLQSHVNRSLEAAAEQNPNVFFFQTFPNFCDASRCYALHDKTPLYWDADHLSVSGALSLYDYYRRTVPPKFSTDVSARS